MVLNYRYLTESILSNILPQETIRRGKLILLLSLSFCLISQEASSSGLEGEESSYHNYSSYSNSSDEHQDEKEQQHYPFLDIHSHFNHEGIDALNLLGGSTPTFLSRIGYFLKYQFSGWESAVRMGQSSYQVIMMSGNIGGNAPRTFSDGQAWAGKMINSIKSLPFMNTNRPDRGYFFVTHEFAANGSLSSMIHESSTWEYNAKNPITNEAYSGIRSSIFDWIKSQPKGYTFILGGTAVDTGLTSGSKKIGKNVGFIATSGSTELAEVRKRFVDPVDQWDEQGFLVPEEGSGYTQVSLDTLIPGNQDYFAISTCKDAAQISSLPEQVAMYFISGSGVPSTDQIVPTNPQTTKIIVDMQQFSDPALGGAHLHGGLYELSPNSNPSLMSKVLGTAKSFWTITPGQAQKSLRSYTAMQQARITFREGGTMLVTKPRPFPVFMSAQQLENIESNMVKNQSTVAEQSYDPPESSTIEDAGDKEFDQTLTATSEQIEKAENDFGKEK